MGALRRRIRWELEAFGGGTRLTLWHNIDRRFISMGAAGWHIFGPRVQAVVGYLTGRLGLSHRDVVETMETLHGLELGLGTVAALQQQLSAALEQPVETAQQFAHWQSVHYVDETGWPESSKQKWLWIHATPQVTVFKIRPGRSKDDALAVLGWKFTGVANTDRYNAYHWISESKRQLCWAHLKREAQAIYERGGKSAEIGAGLLAEVKQLFEYWYQLRGEQIDRPAFQAVMVAVEQRVGGLRCSGGENPSGPRANRALDSSSES